MVLGIGAKVWGWKLQGIVGPVGDVALYCFFGAEFKGGVCVYVCIHVYIYI